LKRHSYIGTVLIVLVVVTMVFVNLLPVYWLASTSLRSKADQFAMPPKLMFVPTLEHFKTALGKDSGYFHYFKNSTIVAVGATSLTLLLGVPTAYSIARLKLRRKRDIAFYILTLRFAAPIGVLLPLFLTFRTMGLLDTYPALILLHTIMNLPLVTWMMKGFIEDVPKEIEESAKIDGCTELGSMMRIVLPCSLPGMIATSILSAIFSWNELFFAVALTGQKTKTLPVALYGYVSVHQIDWGALGASGLVTAIPVVLFAILVQRYVVKGLTFGAVKG